MSKAACSQIVLAASEASHKPGHTNVCSVYPIADLNSTISLYFIRSFTQNTGKKMVKKENINLFYFVRNLIVYKIIFLI